MRTNPRSSLVGVLSTFLRPPVAGERALIMAIGTGHRTRSTTAGATFTDAGRQAGGAPGDRRRRTES